MIEKLKTTVTIEARKETSNAVYMIIYSIVDGILMSVNSSITKKIPVDGVLNGISEVFAGNISLSNGSVSCSIPQENDVESYMTEFMTIVEDIKNSIV